MLMLHFHCCNIQPHEPCFSLVTYISRKPITWIASTNYPALFKASIHLFTWKCNMVGTGVDRPLISEIEQWGMVPHENKQAPVFTGVAQETKDHRAEETVVEELERQRDFFVSWRGEKWSRSSAQWAKFHVAFPANCCPIYGDCPIHCGSFHQVSSPTFIKHTLSICASILLISYVNAGYIPAGNTSILNDSAD